MNEISKYRDAVVAIKTAILQGQYEAARGVNRIQLAVYFGVGKYLSLNTRKGVWARVRSNPSAASCKGKCRV